MRAATSFHRVARDMTETDIKFRAAGSFDHVSTRKVVADAFGTDGAATAEYLDALRTDGCILGEWLAEDLSGPIAHIVFSRVWLERSDGTRQPGAMLTPLAVRPDRQRVGVGTQLTEHALRALEAHGERLFLVLGHPGYYPRVGFCATRAAGIESPWRGEAAFMARASSVPNGRLIMPPVISDNH